TPNTCQSRTEAASCGKAADGTGSAHPAGTSIEHPTAGVTIRVEPAQAPKAVVTSSSIVRRIADCIGRLLCGLVDLLVSGVGAVPNGAGVLRSGGAALG